MKRTGTEDRIVGPHQHFKQIDAYVNGVCVKFVAQNKQQKRLVYEIGESGSWDGVVYFLTDNRGVK